MRYTVDEVDQDGFRVIRLADREADLCVSVAPEVGNNAFEMIHRSKNFLWRPEPSLRSLRDKKLLFGIPFLAPWANRLDQDRYWINSKPYLINRELSNIREDPNNQPIHGLLLFEPWEVESVAAGDTGAKLVCRYDFTGRPAVMAQFPFAHQLKMTHTVHGGRLHVSVRIINQSMESLAVAIGFHPYFTLPETSREDWVVDLPARTHLTLNKTNLPTGGKTAVPCERLSLKGVYPDDVFTDLARNGSQHVEINACSGKTGIRVGFGSKYSVAVLYAPQHRDFICIEPMAAITNAFNLAHAGKYDGLQQITPRGSWEEGFWVEPSIDERCA
jgi:aldose 1-epimerase